MASFLWYNREWQMVAVHVITDSDERRSVRRSTFQTSVWRFSMSTHERHTSATSDYNHIMQITINMKAGWTDIKAQNDCFHIRKFTRSKSFKNSGTTLYFRVCTSYSFPVDRKSKVGRPCKKCTDDTKDSIQFNLFPDRIS